MVCKHTHTDEHTHTHACTHTCTHTHTQYLSPNLQAPVLRKNEQCTLSFRGQGRGDERGGEGVEEGMRGEEKGRQ